MTASGSENRQRKVKRTVRFTPLEDALLVTFAEQAGLTPASYLRKAALDMPAPRAGRRPSLDRKIAAQLLGRLGETATAFRAAAHFADAAAVETTMNDLAEYRLVLFEALGRAP